MTDVSKILGIIKLLEKEKVIKGAILIVDFKRSTNEIYVESVSLSITGDIEVELNMKEEIELMVSFLKYQRPEKKLPKMKFELGRCDKRIALLTTEYLH